MIVCPFWKCWMSGSKEYEQSKKAVSPDLNVSATPILVMGSIMGLSIDCIWAESACFHLFSYFKISLYK
jgi:hypothetical protein